MTKRQTAKITWKDSGVPVAEQFDDPYFSLEDGLAETRHVFIEGNDLATRYCPGFQIAELGFGTGLNMLAAFIAWRAAGSPEGAGFTSLEAFPMEAADIERALQSFPEAYAVAGPFLTIWEQGARRFDLDGFTVEVIEGDARETIAAWDGKADAWFLDGFSPAKNPELWGEGLMRDVGRHTAPNGTFATYTAAGFVRRALDAAGFDVERVAGYGRKRHMSRGILRP
ncbi:tRNA U34 5-methylaminomethyl-2-thiouridine-forming methyltransferase MnmC [Aliiroseovarius halocynthiae]|uniref:tRNA (5-methylaminomethyl-2-thiouridine)(34)-methyltransferase MnmD n=1 Tax=Aliiroseovarius halocynthiae TaxID=985055 RepID=A0A545SNG2_9RHOB|nr:tRNA (5-methylaminomethyl-2-thiouridine)(34)-methyltransferase MnmD [Aliiroseovarius halocynthiae]TQV66396.1 tRNA (5-methylaminomethyl-2-thiouridine)(34)-methyltransferase MnmD [Aliiroseovarius halocynthiae]SMR83374.1 tRNA U34 5-methylaminomethyl-2-thiouridine-forming methyltransferase MnmC [Aliiroseovarius halocynthiae]